MFLNRLNLTNFRNYENQCINFIKGINLFVGDNAQGKTNIIESIYLSSFGKSYSATKDVEMINLNKDFLRVQLDYNKKNIDNKVEIYIDKLNKKIILTNLIVVIILFAVLEFVSYLLIKYDAKEYMDNCNKAVINAGGG